MGLRWHLHICRLLRALIDKLSDRWTLHQRVYFLLFCRWYGGRKMHEVCIGTTLVKFVIFHDYLFRDRDAIELVGLWFDLLEVFWHFWGLLLLVLVASNFRLISASLLEVALIDSRSCVLMWIVTAQGQGRIFLENLCGLSVFTIAIFVIREVLVLISVCSFWDRSCWVL